MAIRTTFIVGFPGETDKEFEELVDFIKEMKFERLGVFEYSREEGTKAHDFGGQLPSRIKRERFDTIMKLQQEISKEINARYLGKDLEVLIDEPANAALPAFGRRGGTPPFGGGPHTRKPYNYICRTEHDAPEVDGNCFVKTKKPYRPGEFARVRIVDTLEYDLAGEEI